MHILKYARRTSCFSVGLGLAVSIFQLWIVYHTFAQQLLLSSFGLCIIQLRKKEIVALAVVRVSSGYFAVLECISYGTQ